MAHTSATSLRDGPSNTSSLHREKFTEDMESEDEILLLAALLEDEQPKRKRAKWVHEINKEHEEKGEFYTLVPQLRQDERRFYIYFRMGVDCFDEILSLIEGDIGKQNTNYRRAIPPGERLAIALRFLATGDTYKTIGHSFRVGFSTVAGVVEEVCEAIWRNMMPVYLPEPTKEIWEESARGYQELWQCPNCIGSIDGKHVVIKCPNKSGSNYFSYLKIFSVVLMAIVGPDYKFICIDVGGYGKNSDGGILEESAMGRRLESGTLDVPDDKPLPGQEESTPCVLIGDEAFPLKPYLMRPFPRRQAREDRRKVLFNYRLSRARRVVENAFGILAKKWRVFMRPMEMKVATTVKIVKATCVLHNYLRMKSCDETFFDLIDCAENRLGLLEAQIDNRRGTNYAFTVREKFVNFTNL